MFDRPLIYRKIEIPDFIQKEFKKHDQQVLDFLSHVKEEFVEWFKLVTNLDISPKDSWLNFTHHREGVLNDFDWHNENGVKGSGTVMKGAHAGIIWLSGEENYGGGLRVITQEGVDMIDFAVGTIIIMNKDTFHKVDHYTGDTPRVSLNFTFDLV